MKKTNRTKLGLSHETLRPLTNARLVDAAGGLSDGCGPTFLNQCPLTHPTSKYNMCSGNQACLTATTI
jgi:hypothetical protein